VASSSGSAPQERSTSQPEQRRPPTPAIGYHVTLDQAF
jgi:hypothetical protein